MTDQSPDSLVIVNLRADYHFEFFGNYSALLSCVMGIAEVFKDRFDFDTYATNNLGTVWLMSFENEPLFAIIILKDDRRIQWHIIGSSGDIVFEYEERIFLLNLMGCLGDVYKKIPRNATYLGLTKDEYFRLDNAIKDGSLADQEDKYNLFYILRETALFIRRVARVDYHSFPIILQEKICRPKAMGFPIFP